MENLPIATVALLPTGNVNNTTSAAADAASPDSQNGNDFDALLQRELAREPLTVPLQAAFNPASDDEAGEDARVGASLPIVSNDHVIAVTLAAPLMPPP
ncbi:MAG: hypothetical protein K2Y16_10710, partial [Burkholderiales bacterium]|nr:hypothetical protein [Burkholderiales bacterium]